MSESSQPSGPDTNGGEMNGGHLALNIPESISELADCFRPGIDDLQSAEFAPLAKWIAEKEEHRQLFEKLCDLDQEIGAIYRHVDVPQPVVERLQALGREGISGAPKVQIRGQAIWRRPAFRWAAVAVSVTILIGIIASQFWTHSTIPMSAEKMCNYGLQWVMQVQNRNDWTKDLGAAPTDRPMVDDVVTAHRAWLEFETLFDERTVSYDLGTTSGPPTYLFVVKTDVSIELSTIFPTVPHHRTGAYSVGLCRQGDLLYVLVVNGNEQAYRDTLKRRGQPT